MKISKFPYCFAIAWWSIPALTSPTLLVELDYISLLGNYSSTYNISYWRKVPFGASTAGENRFRAPQPPASWDNQTYVTDSTFDMCPQRTVNGSEDCLYLGLYSRPWSPGGDLRPVLVNFYGGAYIEGSASFAIPPPLFPILNVSTANDFVVVHPNYRVNAFGFLPGREVQDSPQADLNVGLLDQQFALQWVSNYISSFGGDPSNVTIMGQSAGAGSVVAQVIANGGIATPALFAKALPSSPFWARTYNYDAPPAQAIYDQLIALTGCDGTSDSLSCLKQVDVQAIRNASLVIDADHTYTTSSYTWAPVIGGSFLTERLSTAVLNELINPDFVFGMYNSHEGENFIPPSLQNTTGTDGFNSSAAGFDVWLDGFLPDFSIAQIDQVKMLYPAAGTAEVVLPYNTTFERAQLIFRDVVLACPAYWVADTAKTHGYLGEYNISPAKHGSDTAYWNQVNAIQTTEPLIYKGFAGAFASFIETGDPNAHKLTNASEPSVPELTETVEEYVIESFGFSAVTINQLEERCAFWLDNAASIPL